MTEQEYEKLVSESAETHSKNGLPPLVFDAAARFRDKTGDEQTLGVIRVIEVAAFKAGIKWARENPGPEVLELVAELTAIHDELLDWLRGGTGCPHCALAMVKIGKCLARFKERTAGKGEE